MGRLTEKQLLFLTIGITVLLSGGMGFLIWTDLQAIEEEAVKIEDLRKQIQSAEGEIRLIPMREHRVIANREISDKEVAFLPEEEEIENFWEVLERVAAESGVQISEIAPSNKRVGGRRGKKKSTTIQSVPQIMSLRGTINEFLRFINMVENYDRIINVVEYSLTSGDVADDDGKVRHGIRLALTTFTYSRKIASTIVSIPKYEEKREHPEVKKWLSRIKIQEKETYTLQPSLNRRDPFVSIRRRPQSQVNPQDEPNRAVQEGTIDNLVELVRTLQEGLDYEEELQRRGDLWRLQAQRRENRAAYRQLAEEIPLAKRDITIAELTERLKSEVIAPWTEIQKRMDELSKGNPALTREQVKEWFDKIAKFFDEHKWAEVEEEVRAFNDASKQGQHVADDARDLVVKIIDMRRSARVIQNFEKRRIKISTILYSPDGQSVAVINGKQMVEEDALDTEGTVIVVEIGENYVIFETEGVEIKRTQDDSSSSSPNR
ncbi:MAG: type 4a pilus biogenesis protein PilO [Planctomycetota bacterium]